ncbi:MAG: hypothetical protein HYT30_02315 [Parcubacteria group bacterium]|nr:hypothetical protein [Parcubacteria group bacterium]
MKRIVIAVVILAGAAAAYYAYTQGWSPFKTDINARIDTALSRAPIDVSEFGGGTVMLTNGKATFTAGEGGGQGLIMLGTPRAVVVKGDDADVLVLVHINGGGSGTFAYLVHFEYTSADDAMREVQRIILGDRIIVDDIVAEITSPTSYEVIVSLKDRKVGEAMASVPTESRVLTFGRGDAGLELHAVIFGTLAEHSVVLVSPMPGAEVPNAFVVKGAARGPWYFEASFPIELRTYGGDVLATVIAQAQGEWMTEDLVPFSTTVVAPSTMHGPAILVLKKDNPSGLPEHDASVEIPVVIK